MGRSRLHDPQLRLVDSETVKAYIRSRLTSRSRRTSMNQLDNRLIYILVGMGIFLVVVASGVTLYLSILAS